MEIRIVKNTNADGDWYGLYIGEELMRQGRSFNISDVLDILNIGFNAYETDSDGLFPKYIGDIQDLKPKKINEN